MAIIDYSSMASSAGWTTQVTNGTITFGVVEGSRTFVRQTRSGGALSFSVNGLYRTTPVTPAAGHVIYFDFRVSAVNSCMNGQLATNAAIEPNGADDDIKMSIDWALAGGVALSDTEENDITTGGAISANIWYNARLTIQPSGSIAGAIHEDSGIKPWLLSEGSWTLIDELPDTGVIPNTNYTTTPAVYFATTMYETNFSLDTDEYIWTSNGSVPANFRGATTYPGRKWIAMGLK